MPLFAQSSPFDSDVEKATSEMNTVEDWGIIMDICDKVKNTNGSKECLRSIVKRLNHRVPFVSMQALTLLNACVNNCGREFHLEICSRDFISDCRTLIGQKAHPRVAQKLKFLVKSWAESKEFKDDPALNLIPTFYDSLKKDGQEFSDPDNSQAKTTKPVASKDPNVVQSQQEEDDIAKAIALSLQEEKTKDQQKTYSLYPSGLGGGASSSPISSQQRPREVRKVRALYDFEAAEDNELTFKAGELISVLDDSDPNWWKGFNQGGDGLFPANFVTSDLTVEPEEPVRKVAFSEEVQVKTIEAPEEVEIDESKIDNVLQLIQNADPTGENHPDTMEMLQLEEQCKAMGPLIDAELEKIDRKHADLCGLNSKVLEALQMYHNLMKENPMPYAYKTMSGNFSNPSSMGIPQAPVGGQPVYNGSQYLPQGQIPQMNQGQMPPVSQGQIPVGVQGQMSMGQGQMTMGNQAQQPQTYSSSHNFSNNATAPGVPQTNYQSAQTSIPYTQQNAGPSPQHQNAIPSQQQQQQQQAGTQFVQSGIAPVSSLSSNSYGQQNISAGHSVYQQAIPQQQLL